MISGAIQPICDLRPLEVLLLAEGLPATDLNEGNAKCFFGVHTHEGLQAAIGLELYGPTALLRSLVVAPAHRCLGWGRNLVLHVERFAADRGVRSLYLLTNDAQVFFSAMGYVAVSRDAAPQHIVTTRQFANLCPATATLMVRALVGRV